MSREIKFRAKHRDTGAWNYGGSIITASCDKPSDFLLPLSTFWQQVEKGMLLDPSLYTGINDCENNEIYEGSTVSADIDADGDPSILEVQYYKGAYIIEYEDSEYDFYIIGWFPGSMEIVGS